MTARPLQDRNRKGLLTGMAIAIVVVLGLSLLFLWGARQVARNKLEKRAQASLAEHGRKLREVDPARYKSENAPAFVNDPAVLGRWVSVDYVDDLEEFQPGVKSTPMSLYLQEILFQPNGVLVETTQKGGSPAGRFVWSNGVVYDKSRKTLSKYQIKTIGNDHYLFFEWVSGDVIDRGVRPFYYVLKEAK